MINRKTTVIIADYIAYLFAGGKRRIKGKEYYFINIDKLYEFLYENNNDTWFCNLAMESATVGGKTFLDSVHGIRQFILRLHTGESILSEFPNNTLEEAQLLGYEYLFKITEDLLKVEVFDDYIFCTSSDPLGHNSIF